MTEQCAAQSARLGSMLNSRALHSAVQDSRLSSHRAAVRQAAQLLADCAATRHGDMHSKTSARIRVADFTIIYGRI
jgi:hypothetical protein